MSKENVEYTLYNGATATFEFEQSLPLNYVYWDTVTTYKKYKAIKDNNFSLLDLKFVIYYNIPKESAIGKIKSNLNTIFETYIQSSPNEGMNAFKSIPSADTALPAWASFNPQMKMFCFEAKLFFDLKTDNRSIRNCYYLTKPSESQTSEAYQYANASKSCVCSNPKFYQNDNQVPKCLYSISGILPMNACSGYTPDEKILFTNKVIHKVTDESFEITTLLYRSAAESYRAELINKTTGVTMLTLDYGSIIFSKDKTNLYTEISLHLNDVLSEYQKDYNIEYTYDYTKAQVDSVSVNIKSKNSYISTLLSKDSYGDQKSKTLQSV